MEKPEQLRCMDCDPRPHPTWKWPEDAPYCPHFTPEWWEKKHGYKRRWGDASVMRFPVLEILRKETDREIRYLILNAELRRPVELYFSKGTDHSWGSY
jgi:hypothetical protein